MQFRGSKNTSWGGIADWYAEHLEGEDTYHTKVIIPNVVRIAALQKGQKVLDLACGEGTVTRILAHEGAQVTGVDIADELIAKAKKNDPTGTYVVAPADKLPFATEEFDVITCILALQNMELIDTVFAECARVLKKGGRFILVMNHPVLRIPKRSFWDYDKEKNIQYRRLDGYIAPSKEKMVAHPGRGEESEVTWSFHRPLQEWFKSFRKTGFVTLGVEEWISHRQSEKGPRAQAEDRARKEFPLFLMIECQKL